jgi:hypothetical protein
MGGYSLGLYAPKADNENGWFGHGGAWGTNCQVNYHKKELKMWVIQCAGGGQPWQKDVDKAAEQFFNQSFDSSAANAYTGRTK